jgi:putative phosphoesterase
MRLVVVSDTHGSTEYLSAILARHPHVAAFHCGDFCYPREQAPEFTYVRGNCDIDREAPEEKISEIGPLRIFQTHGHTYGVKQTAMRLRYRALEAQANVVLFGHTHEVTSVVEENILFVNPGSLLLPRSHTVPTYAVLDVTEAEHDVQIEVAYYSPDGKHQPRLGGIYRVPRANKE